METSGLFILLDYLMIAYGAYAIYGAWKLRRSGEIPSALWSKDLPMRKCKDKEGFISFIVPRFIISGVLILATGILGVIADKHQDLHWFVDLLPVLFIVVELVWFIIFTKKAQKRYF